MNCKTTITTLTLLTAVLALTACQRLTPIIQSGFTDYQIRQCEQSIRDYYLTQGGKHPLNAVEKQDLENGKTAIEVRMIKIADRELKGYVKFSINTQEAKDLGLSEVFQNCTATMAINSSEYMWRCGNGVQP